MKKVLNSILACILVLQPVAPTVTALAVTDTEHVIPRTEEPVNFINDADALLEDLLGPADEKTEAPIDNDTVEDEEQPPEEGDGVHVVDEAEDAKDTEDAKDVEDAEDADSEVPEEDDHADEDEKDYAFQEGDNIEDYIWDDRFLVVDPEGDVVDLERVMSRSGSNAQLIVGSVIPHTRYKFTDYGWVDPGNPTFNLWQSFNTTSSGIPKLSIRVGGQTFTVFCIEPAVVPRNNANGYNVVNLVPQNPSVNGGRISFSANQRNTIERILLYGYGSNFLSSTQRTSDNAYVATQSLIWEVIAATPRNLTNGVANANAMLEWNKDVNNITGATNRSAMHRAFINNNASRTEVNNLTGLRVTIPAAPAATRNARIDLHNQIKTNVVNHGRLPSFMQSSATQANNNTHTMRWNAQTRQFSVTLTDTNGVLANFFTGTSATIGDYRLTRSGNTLTVTTTNVNAAPFTFRGDQHAQFRKEFSGSAFHWSTGGSSNTGAGSQGVAWGGVTDPINSFMRVQPEPPRTVTVRHRLEGTNIDLIPSHNLAGTWRDGDVATSHARTDLTHWFEGRHVPVTPTQSSQTVTVNGNMVITHYYRTQPRNVTVRHRLEGTTTDIIPQHARPGTWFDGDRITDYARTDLTYRVNGRDVSVVPTQVSQTVTVNGNTTITHYYRMVQRNVTVRHRLVNTDMDLIPAHPLEGGPWYDRETVHSDPRHDLMYHVNSFSFVVAPVAGRQTATINGSDIVITHYYELQRRTLRVEHRDELTGELITTLNGEPNVEYPSGVWRDGDRVTASDAPHRTFTAEVSPWNPTIRNWEHTSRINTSPTWAIPVTNHSPNFPVTINGDTTLVHYYRRPVGYRIRRVNHYNQNEQAGQTVSSFEQAGRLLNTNGLMFQPSPWQLRMPDGTQRFWRLETSPDLTVLSPILEDQDLQYTFVKPLQLTSRYLNHVTGEVLLEPQVDNTGYDRERYTSPVLQIMREMPDGTQRPWLHETSVNATGIFNNNHVTATHRYRRPALITIEHVDKETGRIILTEEDNSYYSQDETEAFCPSPDLVTEEGYVYVSEDECIVVSVGEEDVTIRFEYDIPTLQIDVDRIEITTGVDELPVEVSLSHEVEHAQHLGNITYQVRITNLLTGEVSLTPERAWQNFRVEETLVLPTKGMKQGEQADFSFEVVTLVNSAPNRVETDSTDLRTWGYKASESLLTVDDFDDNQLEYEAPVRTVAIRQEGGTDMDVEVLNEKFTVEKPELDELFTGRGFTYDVPMTYESEIDNEIEYEVTLTPDNRIVDGDFYERQNNQAIIPLENTEGDLNDGLWQVPHVFAKSDRTGEVISADAFTRLARNDQANYHDGGRQILTPIWDTDLGTYELQLVTTEKGINEFSVYITDELTLRAFLFGWETEEGPSPTIREDQVLVTPVHATDRNNTGMLDIWSDGSHPDNWGVSAGGQRVLTDAERQFLGLD